MENVLWILFFGLIIFSNLYIFQFQRSVEGTDERGQAIQLETTKSMYQLLYLGILILIILNLIDVVTAVQTVTFILYLLLITSVYGAFLVFRKRR